MKLACSRCEKKLGEKEPLNDPRTEKTMCVDCLEFLEREWRGMTVGDYLDSVDAPVMLVDSERRMVSCNKKAEKVLGKSRGVMKGLMAGEFLECHNSILSEGCGKSIHCSACTIRKSIEGTIKTGESVKEQPAYFNTMERGVPVVKHIKVSTEKEGNFVRLQIQGIGDHLLKGPEKAEEPEPKTAESAGDLKVKIRRTPTGAPMVVFEKPGEETEDEGGK
jgi:hypothetical protein